MNRASRILSFVIVAGTMLAVAAPNLRAESAIPDPATFFAGLVNPKAKGKTVTGYMTIAYDFVDPGEDCFSVNINNMYVVTNLEYRRTVKPFNRDFTDPSGIRPPVAPFCFDDFPSQLNFVLSLFREEVIPFFFQCTPPACPPFEVKSLKSFLSSGTGAISTEIKLKVRRGDDDGG